MSTITITYLVAACTGLVSFVAYVGWVVVPAWGSYSRAWQRVAAAFLSLYVLATFAGLGFAAGVGVILLWDRVG